ncbi:L2 [Leptonychotes weddellii papillomavirus 3]|uniref:Minor capsid protein L2 n=1 Tax=Leptonychotes weddellii papillomavirus 3 TaxID=2077304 RepID=A0A2I8B2Q2_9PAPI|nr:L2 [Leptonychotes weddellii papillomavirus 3]AUT11915.1 L2 [Leptonychotes weddellii papillomavirus 3]
MPRARRTKRASAAQLYQSCKQGGDCAPDVVNKFEGKTVADKILQYGSLGVYFGGLGIGTGTGSGGRFGYGAIGGRATAAGRPSTFNVPTGAGTRSIRPPPVIIDTIGPSSVLPVEAYDPGIVSLVDASDVSLDVIEVAAEVPPGVPRVPPGGAGGAPVVTSGSSDAAVLELAPEPSVPSRGSVSRSHFSNPAFEVSSTNSNHFGETSASSTIFVTHATEGIVVGEEIPLQEFPRTSTPQPRSTVEAPRPRQKGGYPARFREQIHVRDRAFLEQPGRLVTFDFDNPTFQESLEFSLGPDEVRAAPTYEFRDIVKLSRPNYSETPSGHVRVSRFGQRATITTRAGTQIGSQAHFYHDISTITTPESIELQVLGEHSTTHVTVSEGGDAGNFEVIDLNSSDTVSLESGHTSILETDDTPVIRGRLVIGSRRFRGTVEVPLPLRGPMAIVDGDYQDTGIYVDYPRDSSETENIPDVLPSPPSKDSTGSGPDFYLHPSLRRRKLRKRRYLSFFLF